MTETTSTATGEQVAREQDPQVHGHMVINEAAPTTERPRRKRGAGFPVVPLPEAATIMRKSGKFGDDHSQEAFAGYMGHSTANSGSFKRRIASFRDWEFIANATGNRVVFTDLGRRIGYPTDPEKERSDLQEAFENCEIFMKVWDNSAKGVVISAEALANLAVRQLGVAPVSKEQFAESLIESAAAAGFAKREGDKVVFVRPHDQDAVRQQFIEETDAAAEEPAKDETPVMGRMGQRTRRDLGVPVRQAVPSDIRTTPVAARDQIGERVTEEIKPAVFHRQAWDFGDGSLTFEIRSDSSLPAEAFMQIGKVMAEVETLKAILTKDTESEESTE